MKAFIAILFLLTACGGPATDSDTMATYRRCADIAEWEYARAVEMDGEGSEAATYWAGRYEEC